MPLPKGGAVGGDGVASLAHRWPPIRWQPSSQDGSRAADALAANATDASGGLSHLRHHQFLAAHTMDEQHSSASGCIPGNETPPSGQEIFSWSVAARRGAGAPAMNTRVVMGGSGGKARGRRPAHGTSSSPPCVGPPMPQLLAAGRGPAPPQHAPLRQWMRRGGSLQPYSKYSHWHARADIQIMSMPHCCAVFP
jgi:hypothetical protein